MRLGGLGAPGKASGKPGGGLVRLLESLGAASVFGKLFFLGGGWLFIVKIMKEKPGNWNKAFLEGRLGARLGGLGSGSAGCVWGLWGHLGGLLGKPGSDVWEALGQLGRFFFGYLR